MTSQPQMIVDTALRRWPALNRGLRCHSRRCFKRATLAGANEVRRLLRAATPLALAFILTSCAERNQPSGDAFATAAGEVVDAGYTHISQRYVETLSMSDVALAGMKGVSQIDPELQVTRDRNHIVLAAGKAEVREFTAPRDDDPDDWAEVTIEVLEAGRAVSPTLHDAGMERIYAVVFDGALSRLDHFSRYASAAIAREQRAQRDGFGGIGITIKLEGEEVRVVSVVEDTPAARLGIQPEDAILAINGQPTQGWALANVVERLRGPVGSTLRLTTASAKEHAPHELALRRALIIPPTVSYVPRGDVADIKLTSFNQNTTSSLAHALRRATREMGKQLRGVVIDLRGNPGGLLDQAVTVSDLFLTHGRILSTSGRHPDSNQTFDATGDDLLHGLPIALLVNGGTASAAEVVAAALQDQGRAIVVGTASYGKGTVQTVHRLPNDGEIIITWSHIHAPSGYNLNHVGVIPNVCTSKLEADTPAAAMAVVEEVRNGRVETAAARAALRANGSPSDSETRQLRASCPPKGSEGAADLEVAQKIIEDGTLFAHVLAPAPSPEIAKRQ